MPRCLFSLDLCVAFFFLIPLFKTHSPYRVAGLSGQGFFLRLILAAVKEWQEGARGAGLSNGRDREMMGRRCSNRRGEQEGIG